MITDSATGRAGRESKQSERAALMRAALDYADRGWPVFPCRPGGKEPLTKRGHLDASTDPRQIHLWWNRWPTANVAVPTGQRSGLLVLDVDHPAGLDALEASHGKLPATRTHSTGSGGMHYLYRYPGEAGGEIRNSASKLAEGLDVRGEGGYIVVPPSATTRPYKVLDPLTLAEPPGWFLEALRRPQSGASFAGRSHRTGGPDNPRSPGPIALDRGGPIPAGTRDDTLTSIAGRLHDGTRTLEALTAELLGVNADRCEPPLPDGQVEKIARSIHTRTPCKQSTRATPEVLREIDAMKVATEHHEWDPVRNDRRASIGGHTDRDLYVALLRFAREHGESISAGVRVPVSVRALAEEAAIGSTRTVVKGLDRLRVEHRLIRRDGTGSGPKSGALVLLKAPNARGNTRPPSGLLPGGEEASVSPCVPPLSAERLRWSAPGHGGRLGKIRGRIIDLLEASGPMTLDQIALAMNRRPYDLRTRTLPGLETAGVVECSSGMYRLAADWRSALKRRRKDDGEIAAAERQRDDHKRQQRAFRHAWEKGEVVSKEELLRLRRDRTRIRPEERHVSGTIDELEPVPEPPEPRTLTGLIGTRVGTPRGPGVLWDHKGEEARVVLDADPSRWVPLDVRELLPEVAA